MRNYVVGILSMFENDLQLFKITADNEYEAVKKGMIEFCPTPESKQYEIDLQKSDNYPQNLDGLVELYSEVPFNTIEI